MGSFERDMLPGHQIRGDRFGSRAPTRRAGRFWREQPNCFVAAMAAATQRDMIRCDGFGDRDLDHLTCRPASHDRGVEPITATGARVRAMLNNRIGRPAGQSCAGRAGLLAWPARHTTSTITGRFAGLAFSSATYATINRVP